MELGIPVGELSTRMTALEETYWIAKCGSKPFPSQRIETMLSMLCQIVFNSNVTKPQNAKKLSDFMLWRKKPKPVGDDQQTIRANFERIIARQKGK